MPVPLHRAVLRRLVMVPLVLSAALAFGFVRGPQPDVRIPLNSLGFEKLTQEFLLHHSSMLTLNFVDSQHLLLTFEVRTLLKRIPGDPPDDQDRNIRALLLELPSGRVLARTDWRTHDRGQYLWDLGQGHFLLRIRDTLTTFAPLRNLSAGDAFQQDPFLNVLDRRIGVVLLTPEADVLTVETKALTPAANPDVADDPTLPAGPNRDPVQVNFYRIDNSSDAVHARYAGAGLAPTYGAFPLTGAGYLETLDQGHQRWAFNFDTFAGQVWELAYFDSTCRPAPVFVSRGEFIAFGCHNTPTPQVFGGFNMRGEETWQQGLFGDYIDPHLVFSPASGRFAFGRVLTTTPLATADPLVPGTLSSQTVIVYQAGSGRQVLKVDCSPIVPAGQNFALAPDGLSFGVVADGAVEIYKLPPLTLKEQTDLNLALSSSPKPTELPVRFAGSSSAPATPDKAPAQPATQSAAQSAAQPPTQAAATAPSPPSKTSSPASASSPSSAAQPQPAPTAAISTGDPSADHPRKPPTLYTLPTDPPHNPSQSK